MHCLQGATGHNMQFSVTVPKHTDPHTHTHTYIQRTTASLSWCDCSNDLLSGLHLVAVHRSCFKPDHHKVTFFFLKVFSRVFLSLCTSPHQFSRRACLPASLESPLSVRPWPSWSFNNEILEKSLQPKKMHLLAVRANSCAAVHPNGRTAWRKRKRLIDRLLKRYCSRILWPCLYVSVSCLSSSTAVRGFYFTQNQ